MSKKKISKFLREKLKYECYCRNVGETPCFRPYSIDPKRNKKWYMRQWCVCGAEIIMNEIYGSTKQEVLDKHAKLLKTFIVDTDTVQTQYTEMDLSLIMIRLNKLRIQLSFPIKVEMGKTYFTGHLAFRNSALSKMSLEKFSEKERGIIVEIIRLEKRYAEIKKDLIKNNPDLELDNS